MRLCSARRGPAPSKNERGAKSQEGGARKKKKKKRRDDDVQPAKAQAGKA